MSVPMPTAEASVRDVRAIDLPSVRDARGVLTAVEAGTEIPFDIRRVFFLHDIRGDRGGHAHRATRQLLVAVAGAFTVEVSDGADSVTHVLRDPHRALYVPPLLWVRLHDFEPGAVCLVLADVRFADSEYLRDWDEFVRLRQRTGGAA